MKRYLVIAFLASGALLSAEEPAVSNHPIPNSHIPQAPRAWMGLDVSKADEAITAHIPGLPPGIGFVIRFITPGGPAETAGLRNYDILWKMGDQMLVNEGQLAALLRLAHPGDEVSLSGFRAGRPIEVKLKLGETPPTTGPVPNELVDSTILPGAEPGVPMRVFNISEKTASYSAEDGRVEVQRDGTGYKVKITSPKDEMLFAGELPADGSLVSIPDAWKKRVLALRRGLDHAMDGGLMPIREPRPRIPVPASAKP